MSINMSALLFSIQTSGLSLPTQSLESVSMTKEEMAETLTDFHPSSSRMTAWWWAVARYWPHPQTCLLRKSPILVWLSGSGLQIVMNSLVNIDALNLFDRNWRCLNSCDCKPAVSYHEWEMPEEMAGLLLCGSMSARIFQFLDWKELPSTALGHTPLSRT